MSSKYVKLSTVMFNPAFMYKIVKREDSYLLSLRHNEMVNSGVLSFNAIKIEVCKYKSPADYKTIDVWVKSDPTIKLIVYPSILPMN